MRPSPQVSSKTANFIRALARYPRGAVPGNILSLLKDMAGGEEISPDSADLLLQWYEKDGAIEEEIKSGLLGKSMGLSFLRALAKQRKKDSTPAPLQAEREIIRTVSSGARGNHGYSPILALVNDGDRVVQQVVDWVGGEGVKPAVGQFIKGTGFTSVIAEATNVRGPISPPTGVPVFISDSPPVTDSSQYLWVQTGLGVGGADFTFFFEDGT